MKARETKTEGMGAIELFGPGEGVQKGMGKFLPKTQRAVENQMEGTVGTAGAGEIEGQRVFIFQGKRKSYLRAERVGPEGKKRKGLYRPGGGGGKPENKRWLGRGACLVSK